MSFSATIDLGYEFAVPASFDEVYAVVSDVPTSAGFFPHLERLVPLGRGAYRWEMAPVGLAEAHIQTVYASQYRCSKAKGSVVWTPVKGVGNAQVSGSWAVARTQGGTQLTLHVNGCLELALPALLKPVIVPLVQAEFERMVEQYIDNLIEHWGGEL